MSDAETSRAGGSLVDLAADIDACCRLTGEFTLRSGQQATEYFDKYPFESQPGLLDRVAARMVGLLPDDTELLGGLELGLAMAAQLGAVTTLGREQPACARGAGGGHTSARWKLAKLRLAVGPRWPW